MKKAVNNFLFNLILLLITATIPFMLVGSVTGLIYLIG